MLLVDAEGHISREILPTVVNGSADDLGSYPTASAGSSLRVLPYLEKTALPAGLIGSLKTKFDIIIVACGSSQYANDFLLTADRVVVSSGTGRELEESLRSVDQLRGSGDTLLAPMGRLKLPEGSSRYPVFRLPSYRNVVFEQAESEGKFAAFTDEKIGKSFRTLLEELLSTGQEAAHTLLKEEPEQLSRGEAVQIREEAKMSPEDTSENPGNSHGEHVGEPPPSGESPPSEQSPRRLSADEMVERMRQGAQRSGDSVSAPEPESSADEPPKSRLQKIKTNVATFSNTISGKFRRRGDSNREGETNAYSSEEIERRLKLSLRETAVGGISRVCVGSPKGGVGKSSIAYALAGSIAYYTNLRVCLVDTDPNFGSMRLLVPRPIERSVVSLAKDADSLKGLSDIRAYVAQNERMRLDVVLGPEHAHEMAQLEDLGEAYGRIDSVLSKFYDLVVYDLGLGFRDPAIREVLSLSDELLFVTDSEVIPNAMLSDAIQYVQNLGVDLNRTTLVMNHRLPASDESALALQVRNAHTSLLRRVTEVPYDARMSRLLNQRSFHIEELSSPTRLGVLTTVAACLEGLRDNRDSAYKVVTQGSDYEHG